MLHQIVNDKCFQHRRFPKFMVWHANVTAIEHSERGFESWRSYDSFCPNAK